MAECFAKAHLNAEKAQASVQNEHLDWCLTLVNILLSFVIRSSKCVKRNPTAVPVPSGPRVVHLVAWSVDHKSQTFHPGPKIMSKISSVFKNLWTFCKV